MPEIGGERWGEGSNAAAAARAAATAQLARAVCLSSC